MDRRQKRLLEVVGSATRFLDETRVALDGVITPVTHSRLSSAYARMQQYVTAQDGAHRERRAAVEAKKRAARDLVVRHMRPIAVALDFVAHDELDAGVRLSPPRSATGLAAAACAMLAAGRTWNARLATIGMTAQHVEALDDAISRFRKRIAAVNDARTRAKAATAGLAVASRETKLTMRLIHAVMQSRLEHDDALLARWEAIVRRDRRWLTRARQQGTTIGGAVGGEKR